MQQAFGQGAVAVPVIFIIIAGLIFWQERFVDAPVTSSNVAGVLMLALLALAIMQPKDLDQQVPLGTGGGIVGMTINNLLVKAFGIGGAWTVLLLLLIVAVLLTFNVTLRQLGLIVHRAAGSVQHRLLGNALTRLPPLPAVEEELDEQFIPAAEPLKPKRAARVEKAAPVSDTALQQELVLTPIAARPTQAGLFDHGRERHASAHADKSEPSAATGTTSQPTAQAGKTAALDTVAQIDISPSRQLWTLPPLDMLDDYAKGQVDESEKRTNARIIEDALASFKIEAQVVGTSPGPAVTQYQLQPAVGVKVSRITSLDRDLALALAAPSIRIEAPIPGTPYIGIEIPNRAIASVSLKEVIDTDTFRRHKGKLKIAIGKDVSGMPVVTDLTRAPHLLIAGSTGSGKSIAINSIIAILLQNNTPDELKFIMIDPKMVEMIVYNQVPHLLAPVVTELERVVSLLKWAVREMERRYKILAHKGFRNIDSYNTAAQTTKDLEPLPYIVIIVDELADLMMLAPDEVETLICRLAQMARAIGIHLILATQRPSVDVVTGLIKANFPTRMAFAVTQQVDSRVILDTNGAEQLLGRGDMLYLASDAAKPIRVQGTYVAENEIERIVRFWRAAQRPDEPPRRSTAPAGVPLRPAEQTTSAPQETPAVSTAETIDSSLAPYLPLPASSTGTLSSEEQDELLPLAIKLVKKHDRASASLLQRRLRIGYTKAAQLIDLMEQQGILGPAEGSRSREVLQPEDETLRPDS